MQVLVDSSVWIDYFRTGNDSDKLDFFIDHNIVCVNDLILAELIPFLKIAKQTKLVKLLNEVEKVPLNIDWGKIIELQTTCLKKGINKVGLPDLMIVDNVIQHNLTLYSFDKHFRLINKFTIFSMV